MPVSGQVDDVEGVAYQESFDATLSKLLLEAPDGLLVPFQWQPVELCGLGRPFLPRGRPRHIFALLPLASFFTRAVSEVGDGCIAATLSTRDIDPAPSDPKPLFAKSCRRLRFMLCPPVEPSRQRTSRRPFTP